MAMNRMQSVCATACVSAFAVFSGEAAAVDWSGLGADNNWSTGANWVGGVAPPSANTTAVSFPNAAAPRRAPVVDAPWTINSLDFPVTGYGLSGQTLTFAGAAPHIGSFAFQTLVTNPIVLTGPMGIQVLQAIFLTGGIGGVGPLAVSGGFIGLGGASTFAGGTTISGAAVLALSGGSMGGPVTVNAFSVLGGAGTISGPVTVNATGEIHPGGFFAGILSMGALSIAGSTVIDITGPVRGAQYGSATVAGTVDLTGATLALQGAFVPPPGSTFTLIVNDGVDAVTGTFAGLPEGATVNFNGVALTISYAGGDGNDVTLAAPGSAPAVAPRQVPTLSGLALLALIALVLAAGIRSRAR
jgi:hypothetical protein